MKQLFLALLMLSLPLAARGATAEKGQAFPPYTVTDAFGGTNTLGAATRFVIVSSEKGISAGVHEWLVTKEKDFLPAHRAEYVADITPMPSLIASMFAIPKMKKYPYKILLARDPEFAKTYPHADGKIAVFILDDRQAVADIRFLDKPAEIDAVLGGGPASP